MKICIINTLVDENAGGGAERSVGTLARGLHSLGHTVTLIGLSASSVRTERTASPGLSIVSLPLANSYWPFTSSGAPLFRKFVWHIKDQWNEVMGALVEGELRAARPDVVITNNLAGFSCSVWAASRRVGIPIVHIIRDYYLLCHKSTMLKSTKVCRKQCTVCAILRRKARTGAGLVSKFIAISKYIAGVHQRAWCWLPDIAVIGNPIEPVIPSAVIENSPKVRFGYIGRLVESKGVREAIEAFRSAGIESDFMIAGKGNPKYIEECRAKAVNAAVSFSGYKAPPDFFSAIDVLVVPSIWPEAFGRVVIEAASAGLPSIVSDRGGLPELVDERKTGWVYSRSSELIGLFREVSRHPLDLRAMESDCRASAERFHPERIVESIEGELLKLGRNV